MLREPRGVRSMKKPAGDTCRRRGPRTDGTHKEERPWVSRRPILPSRSRRRSRPPAGWAVRGIAAAPSAPTRRLPKGGGREGNKAAPASGRAQAPNRTGLTKGPKPPSSPHADRDPVARRPPAHPPSPLLLLLTERWVTTSIKGKAEPRGQRAVLIG